jgi:CBS domain-containing protein
VTVSVTTPLSEAARTMLDKRVHRVVVVDDRFRPVGVLSAIDFVQLFADD